MLTCFVLVSSILIAQTSSDYRQIRVNDEDSILQLIDKTNSDSIRVELYASLMGRSLIRKPMAVDQWFEKAMPLARASKQTEQMTRLRILQFIGWNKTGRAAQSLEIASDLERDVQLLKSQRLKMAFYLDWGNALSLQGRYALAIEKYRYTLDLARTHRMTDIELTALMNLAVMLQKELRFDEMRDLLEQGLVLAQEKKLKNEEMALKLNLGFAESGAGNFGKSLVWFNEVLPYFLTMKNAAAESMLYGNLGYSYLRIGRYGEALQWLKKGEELRMRNGDRQGLGIIHRNLAQVYLETADLKAGIREINKAIALFDSLAVPAQLQEAYRIKAELLLKQNEYVDAVRYMKLHVLLKDSAHHREQDSVFYRKVMDFRSGYSDSLLLVRSRQLEQARQGRTVLGLVCLLLFLTSVWLWWRRKNTPISEKVVVSSTIDLQQLKAQLDRQMELDVEGLVRKLRQETDFQEPYWNEFLLFFARIYPDFFARLKKECPDLTQSELRMCALMKLNLTAQELTDILSISIDGVRKTRYRIYKKMNMSSDQQLEDFLLGF
jgi:tetratricopeptide (TPR) repeat protein/DNA-binding CsgD family transcriptional regulator